MDTTNSMPFTQTVYMIRAEIGYVFRQLDDWCAQPAGVLEIVPHDVGWSIRLILEHVGIVNRFLLLTIRKGAGLALKRARRLPLPDGESDLGIFGEIADPDAFDWRPPAHMIPAGTLSAAEAREILAQQERECLELLESMPHGEGALHRIGMSVRGLGKLDMYQWLWFLLMHARRHLAQMERAVLEDPGCP